MKISTNDETVVVVVDLMMLFLDFVDEDLVLDSLMLLFLELLLLLLFVNDEE